MRVDQARARRILEEEASNVLQRLPGSLEWVERISELGRACEGASQTPIAVLGTAILSKATNLRIDPFSLQASDGKRGYSARSIAQHVLAACAPRLEIDIGVTGKEPLNNQPFFSKPRVSVKLPWKKNALPAARILLTALKALDQVRSEAAARKALRAFLQVRKKKAISVSLGKKAGDDIGIRDFINGVSNFVEQNSEKGKRAQAIVAGLLDIAFDASRVMVTKINDPDRSFPCDVGVRFEENRDALERTFEVRDKIVPESDIYHIVDKCAAAGVARVGIVAVTRDQEIEDIQAVTLWAEQRGVMLWLFTGWPDFIQYAVFSSSLSGNVIGAGYRTIFERLKQLEISREGLDHWGRLSALS